ncbi:MAG TPA: hypothetical protein VF498_11065, partial [Anaerolineales bacterium]
ARAISSRLAPAANALSFHFFFTDEAVRSYSEREGRTRATAVTRPVFQENGAFYQVTLLVPGVSFVEPPAQ